MSENMEFIKNDELIDLSGLNDYVDDDDDDDNDDKIYQNLLSGATISNTEISSTCSFVSCGHDNNERLISSSYGSTTTENSKNFNDVFLMRSFPLTTQHHNSLYYNGDNQWLSKQSSYIFCHWLNCTQSFLTIKELVDHIEHNHVDLQRHANGKFFVCKWNDCKRNGKPFDHRYKLIIHMNVHSGYKPKICPYDGCEKSFSRQENLKNHLRTHTKEKPYCCEIDGCMKTFTNTSDRAKHRRIHRDPKPCRCKYPGCTNAYTDPSSLRKHRKKKHESQPNASITTQNLSKSWSIDCSSASTFANYDSNLANSWTNSSFTNYETSVFDSNNNDFQNYNHPDSLQLQNDSNVNQNSAPCFPFQMQMATNNPNINFNYHSNDQQVDYGETNYSNYKNDNNNNQSWQTLHKTLFVY